MRRTSLVCFAVFFMMVSQSIGDWGAWWWPPTNEPRVVPQNPTSCDVVVMTLGGDWPDSCIPLDSAISVVGTDIYFDVILDYPPDVACATVITGWERTRSIGPLSPGAYTVYARLLGDCFVPDTYTLTTRFTVTAESHVETIYYVDAEHGDDNSDGLSEETSFATIQRAIDTAKSRDTIIVAEGVYTGDGNHDINFYCKAITVRSTNPNDPNAVANTIIDCNGTGWGFDFHSNEGPNSVLAGLTITNGYAGINCSDHSCPTISHCMITKNCADSYAVGIGCHNSGPTIVNCTISGNSARYGRGIYACYKSNLTITDCIITDNVGADHGGGIYCIEAINPTIANCTISDNSATFRGGGIYIRSSSNAAITNCIISSNMARNYCGGGIFINGSNVLIKNCTFSSNFSPNGNALAADSWYPKEPSNLEIANSIFWDGADEIRNDDNSTIIISYGDVQGGWPGEGNIDTDPYFADPNNGDYHLKSQAGRWNPNSQSWIPDEVTSPCIDAGDPSSPIGHEPFPNGGRINMGAYGGTTEASKSYFGEPICETIIAGDINGDCKVDFADFVIMTSHWLNDKSQ